MSVPLGRRQFSRIVVKWPVILLTSQDKTEGETENVSPTGAFISCKEVPISEGSVRMVIRVPGHQPINAAGKVVWSTVMKPNEGSPSFGVGVQFTKISDNDSHFLREVILKRYGKAAERFINTKT
ncbi:MAG: PilZ domain-containing protein [Deltaproteobacteria bacterium]|nr:MAG: PilZ domain-containing protein [Deltaproteobacteria bacterium]